jgi:hypothetical protein
LSQVFLQALFQTCLQAGTSPSQATVQIKQHITAQVHRMIRTEMKTSPVYVTSKSLYAVQVKCRRPHCHRSFLYLVLLATITKGIDCIHMMMRRRLTDAHKYMDNYQTRIQNEIGI